MRYRAVSLLQIVLTLLTLFSASLCFGQNVNWNDIALDFNGKPIANATVTVCTSVAVGTPCSPLAIISNNDQGNTNNPFSADRFGNYSFTILPGTYIIQVSAAGLTTKTETLTVPRNPAYLHYTPTFDTVTLNNQLVFGPGGSILNGGPTVGSLEATTNTGDSISLVPGSGGTVRADPLQDLSSIVASTGNYRLGNSDKICWRNAGNTADICIFVDNTNSFNIQSNTLIVGNLNVTGTISGSGAGSVTNVALAGDGTVFKSTTNACGGPITTTGTFNLANCLGTAQSGFFLRGPVGSQGSNVAFRQSFTCISSGTTATCSATNVASGDALVIIPMPVASGEFFFTTTSDTLGTTWTQYGGSGGTHRAVGFLASSGNDTITLSGGTVASGTPFLIIELTGVSTYNDTNSGFAIVSNSGGIPFTVSNTVTPLAATDSYINVVASNGTCYGGYQINPVSSPIVTWAPGGGQSTGAGWINAPGNTSVITYSGTATTRTGSCHNDFVLFTMDFSQSVAASSAPWIAGPITESDLPPTAISALQSVQTFQIAATVALPSATNTTVLSGTVTMPSQGCPCRVLVQSGIFLNSTTSAQWGFWASDGTNTFGYGASVTTDAHTPPVNIASMSPVSYSNNQSVTFSIIINPGTYTPAGNTVQALSTLSPPLPAGAKSWMTLSIVQSRN